MPMPATAAPSRPTAPVAPMALLTPDRYFSRITCVDIDRDLIGCGRIHVLLDIDNTILARDIREIPRDVGM